MAQLPQYKPKFKNQSYKPKFKQKELIQIARKICSTDWRKSDLDPVEFEWYPEQDLVKIHMTFDSESIDPQETWTLAFPLRPFEIGYDKWVQELLDEKNAR